MLRQRRFFSDPEAREAGPPTRWLAPIVLRYRDEGGLREQRELLDGEEREVSLGTRGEPTHAADASEAKSAGPPLQLLALRLRNGTIRYREGAPGRTLVLEDIAVDAREPHFGGPVPVSVRARLATSDLHLENILSDGVLDLAGEQPAYRGTIAAGPGALGRLPFESLTGEIAASPPVVTLERATVHLLGGTTSGRVRLTSGGTDAGLTARIEASDLDLSQLPASGNRPRPAGKLGLQVDLEGPPPRRTPWQRTVRRRRRPAREHPARPRAAGPARHLPRRGGGGPSSRALPGSVRRR